MPTPDRPAPGDAGAPVDGAQSTRGGRRAIGLSSLLGLVIGGLATAFVIHALTSEWSRVRTALAHASLPWLAAGLLLAAAAMVTMARNWRFALRLLGADRPSRRVVPWYFVGEIGKYLPGGLWSVVGRGELARRDGVPRSRAYASVALSLAGLYLAGLFVAVGLLPFALSGGTALSPWMLFLLALPLGLGLVHHRVLERLATWARRVTSRPLELDVPDWRRSVGLVGRYVPTWFLIGGSTWAVSRSLTHHPSLSRVFFAATLSWVCGFLAVPVPAGAGVREAVFVAASGLPAGLAATVAIATRLLFIGVDVVGAAVSAPTVGWRRRPGAPAPAEAPAAPEGSPGRAGGAPATPTSS